MNNETTTYYVTVDSNNYVLTASSADGDNTLKVNMPNASLADFFAHMGLYKVYKDGSIDFPEFKAATLATQIDALKATADEQVQTVNKLTAQLAASQTMINQLLVASADKGVK